MKTSHTPHGEYTEWEIPADFYVTDTTSWKTYNSTHIKSLSDEEVELIKWNISNSHKLWRDISPDSFATKELELFERFLQNELFIRKADVLFGGS